MRILFGSRSAPGLANRCMNPLFYWAVLIMYSSTMSRLGRYANDGAGAPCAAGTSNMFEHCGYYPSSPDGGITREAKQQLRH